MEIKNLFEPEIKQELIDRINSLSNQSQAKWGKMNVAQMLAHCQLPVLAAYGKHEIKGNLLIKLLGPLFKNTLFNSTPYKKGLPTDKSYIVTVEKEFEKEKSGLLELLSQFSEINIIDGKHPVFGKMTKEQWSKAIWKHIDHHLRQFGA